jgi:hypothetical protein
LRAPETLGAFESVQSVGDFDQRGEFFWGGEEVAGEEEFADFVPVDFWEIEAESNPSARANVGGQVIAFGLGGDESLREVSGSARTISVRRASLGSLSAFFAITLAPLRAL